VVEMVEAMTYEIVVVLCAGPKPEFPNIEEIKPRLTSYDNTSNTLSPCQCYKDALRVSSADILIYCHSDVTIHDADWLTRVLAEFEQHPNCVAVGLGGATSLGHPDLYKKTWMIQGMARGGYRSNQTDYATHGIRETGSCRVAVLDAFFMAVRREFLLRVGGWPVKHLSHHVMDLWLGCEAARHNKEIRMVGVSVTHHGGGTSTNEKYRQAKWLQGGTLESDHIAPHKWLFDAYRDCLPIQVQP